jgi:hypothetical protein
MPDGDGLSHANRAIYDGFLEGSQPKHPLAAALLRSVYLLLSTVGMRAHTIGAFSMVSHVCGAGTLLLLSCSIYPRLGLSRSSSLMAAVGTALSFGVLSRATAIEVYAPALFLDVALTAFCLHARFDSARDAVFATLLFAAGVSIHVTNVCVAPLAIAIVISRTSRGSQATIFWSACLTLVLSAAAICALLWQGPGKGEWPPNPRAILPTPDPEPPMSALSRAARAGYGFCRSIAFLPYYKELSVPVAAVYAILSSCLLAFLFLVATRGLIQVGRARHQVLVLLVLALPFVILGVMHYPSDPERWLFLTPIAWLIAGLAVEHYDPRGGQFPSRKQCLLALSTAILGVGVYNVLASLLPDSKASKHLPGLRTLSIISDADDLIISPAGVCGPINEFFLERPILGENLSLILLAERHHAAAGALQDDLTARVRRRLGERGRVFVYDLIGEGHEAQRNYPWAYLESGYGPDTFLEALSGFKARVILEPTKSQSGLYELLPQG